LRAVTPEERRAICDQINRNSNVPHNDELGIEVVDFRQDTGEAWMRLPYADRLIGDPETGVLHGAAITTLMDAACGMAVFIRIGRGANIATLDLRIDYLKPGRPGTDVIAHAECYKLTRSIAFVRGTAHHPDAPDDAIAAVAATFIRKEAR